MDACILSHENIQLVAGAMSSCLVLLKFWMPLTSTSSMRLTNVSTFCNSYWTCGFRRTSITPILPILTHLLSTTVDNCLTRIRITDPDHGGLASSGNQSGPKNSYVLSISLSIGSCTLIFTSSMSAEGQIDIATSNVLGQNSIYWVFCSFSTFWISRCIHVPLQGVA